MTWWQIILTGSGPFALLAAFFTIMWDHQKRKADAPITIAQADTALKVDHVGMSNTVAVQALALAEALRDQLADVRQDLQREKVRREKIEQRGDSMSAWIRNIIENWNIVRHKETPPPGPMADWDYDDPLGDREETC